MPLPNVEHHACEDAEQVLTVVRVVWQMGKAIVGYDCTDRHAMTQGNVQAASDQHGQSRG